MMKNALFFAGTTAAAVCGLMVGTPAMAQNEAGDIQLKLVGTAVLTEGNITDVNVDAVGLPAGTDTKSNDNYVPTIAAEYFFSKNFSIETIAGTTQHDVDTISGFPVGSELVSDALLLPVAITL